MSNINLEKYGITGTTEIVYNPSYEVLFEEETKEGLEGFEKGQESELGAVNVMTGIYTGRSSEICFIYIVVCKTDAHECKEKVPTTRMLYCKLRTQQRTPYREPVQEQPQSYRKRH